jgi:hypothetical protein
MKIENGIITIDQAKAVSPQIVNDHIELAELSGTTVRIHIKTFLKIEQVMRIECKRKNWDYVR